MRKILSEIIMILLLTSTLMVALNIQIAVSSEPPETEWERTYGGGGEDEARSVIQTSDGGYAMAGWTSSFGAGSLDFWLVKTNASGQIDWHQAYGGTRSDRAFSVIETTDGGYVLAGETWSFSGSADFWLVKTGSDGSMEWNRTYSGLGRDEAYAGAIQTYDGGYLLGGYTDVFGKGQDFWLVKTNSSGDMVWNATFGGESNDVALSLVQTSDGGYAVAGDTASFGAQVQDAYVVKVDSSGHMEWNRTYGGSRYDSAREIIQTSDGGYAIVGFTESYGAGLRDVWLVKTDLAGNMQWNQTYGEQNHDNGDSVVQTNCGGYAIAGTKNFRTGNGDFWLIRADSAGGIQWNKTYGGSREDWGYSMIQTSDEGYAIVGLTESFGAGGEDFWLIKLRSEPISATVDIDPDTLNLKSNGQWITAYITLPESYLVEEIDITSVELKYNNWALLADWGDVQESTLMVKFDRIALRDHLGETDFSEGSKFYDISLTVSGELIDGTSFEGSDTIAVLRK